MVLFNLQYFADTGDAVSATAGADEGAVSSAVAAEQQTPISEVQYGIRDDGADTLPEENKTAEANVRKTLREQLESDGELKKEFDAEVQKIMSRRFKEKRADSKREKDYALFESVMPALNQYYGTSDTNGLVNAIKNDKNLFRESAAEEGKTPEEKRDSFWMAQENESLKQQMEQVEQDRKRQLLYQKWDAETPELMKLYPDFDIAKEMENEEFFSLACMAGLRTAYEHIHRDEINTVMMQYANAKAKEQIAASVASGKQRAPEGVLGNTASSGARVDPRTFSDADFEEIKRRVKAGDHTIRF